MKKFLKNWEYKKARRNNRDKFWCYHKELINNLERSGFSINEDLVTLYEMKEELKRYINLSREAKKRLKWMEYYKDNDENAAKTCRYFGIARKTFYKWRKRYDPKNLFSLEDQDKTPKRKRQREITRQQEIRIIQLRKKYIRYGKEKLKVIYERIYHEKISSWKIQKTIEKYKLYYNPKKVARISQKRRKTRKKRLITELKKKPKSGSLICLDAIVIYWNGLKRYIFTAIDHYGKFAYARMYKSKSSVNAKDFLEKLYYLCDGKIENIQTDNGSEFEGMFHKVSEDLNLKRYWSRVRTPKDNSVDERFNRTLQDEFIALGNFTPVVDKFNRSLTDWLVEYNFNRPHASLNYKTPMEFSSTNINLLPLYSSRTKYFQTRLFVLYYPQVSVNKQKHERHKLL